MTVEPKSIDDFRAILSKSISRPTLYQVIVDFPQGTSSRKSNDQLEFLCNQASVPPVAVNTLAVPGHEAMGVTREQPTMVVFNSPFTISVISDRDYTVYKDLKRWLDVVAVNANPNALANFSGSSQRINYYDEFARSIELKKLELQGGQGSRQPGSYSEPFSVIFNKAYPVRIGEVTLDSGKDNSYVEYTVDFAYETYTFKTGQGLTLNGL